MAVRQIPRAEFDEHGPPRGPMVGPAIQERRWFPTDDGVVIGVLTFDRPDQDWGHVVLGRNENGDFRAIDFWIDIPGEAEAEQALMTSLQGFQDRGETIFPQGD